MPTLHTLNIYGNRIVSDDLIMILFGLLCSICNSFVQLCSFEKITVVLGQPTQHKGGMLSKQVFALIQLSIILGIK